MTIAVSKNKIHEYILKSHKELPETERAVFSLKTLTARKFARVLKLFEDIQKDKKSGIDKLNEAVIDIFRIVLKGWDNLFDDDGNQVFYSYNDIDKILDCLSLAELYELVEGVMECNGLSETQVKN